MRKLRGLFPYVRRHRWPIIGGFVALILTNYFQLQVPGVVGRATDAMKARSASGTDYARYAGLVVLYTVLLGIFRYAMRWWIVGTSRQIEFEFRNDIFRKLQSLPPSFYDQQRTGDLMSRATNDVEAVRMFLGPGFLQFFNSIIIFPLALYQMIRVDAFLTFTSMIPLFSLPFIVNFFGNRVHARFRSVQDHYSTISAMVQENLAGVRVVKAFVQEEAQKKQFGELNRSFINLNMQLARAQAAFFPILRMVAGLSVVLLLWIGGREVVAGRISIGDLVEFSLIQLMLFWPMMALGWTVSLMQRGAASMERIEEVLRIAPEPDGMAGEHTATINAGELEFRDLTFRYSAETPDVLKHVSFRVAAGARLGVVGPTGSGKSTIAALIARLYRVEHGKILIDGFDINDFTAHELRDKVSIVLQETFLFSDTIASNVAFGAVDATEEEIRRAAEEAHIAPEIEEFPVGYQTMLGERGINLSGGQKQRTAIARALIRDPRILVLDDALSAVDTETEERIIESLHGALEGRTAVIIAHRMSAVMHCDEIIVLDEGKIVERGTHDQLMAIGGLYADICEKQQLADAVEAEG